MRLFALAVVPVALAAGCGGDDETKPLIAAGKTAVVRGEIVPSVHLFGDPVVAQVDVIVNREKVDPADVRVRSDFQPYEAVGGTDVTRRDVGDFTHLRYRTELRCLGIDCVPRTLRGNASTVSQLPGDPVFLVGQQRAEQRSYDFAPAVVTAGSGRGAKTLGRVAWAPLRSLSRVNWYDSKVVGQGFPFVATVAPLAKPSYRVPPTLLGLALVVLALGVLAVPLLFVWDRLRVRPVQEPKTATMLSPLERAIRLVVWASRRPGVEERREALEALAFELGHEMDGGPAERARKQGWSPPTPDPKQMTELVTSIRADRTPLHRGHA